jgi:tRNA (uracil-5-)-methyltransferase TRM9
VENSQELSERSKDRGSGIFRYAKNVVYHFYHIRLARGWRLTFIRPLRGLAKTKLSTVGNLRPASLLYDHYIYLIVMDSAAGIEPGKYEEQHVHAVYEQIASHFSSTRYKPWPIVESFLQSLAPGAVGLDVGCGNGKYLTVNRNIFIVGSDRSTNLVKIASQHQPHAAIVADTLSLPHQAGRFDFALSIAVIHHLSTPERRREAIQEILQCVKKEGTALLYVWALEQKSSRRGWDDGHEQDVMVPWVMKTGKKNPHEDGSTEKTFQRYYHLYRSGELERDICAVGGQVIESGYEKDNWWAICQR